MRILARSQDRLFAVIDRRPVRAITPLNELGERVRERKRDQAGRVIGFLPAMRAARADRTYRYSSAFRALLRLGQVGASEADPDPRSDESLLRQAVRRFGRRPDADDRDTVLFGAARAQERSERWRMVAGTWEYIGDRLGDALNSTSDGATAKLLDRYSLPLDQWDDPRSDLAVAGYYLTHREKRAHRQAWAYAHAAEEATANGRFTLATRMRRKAGLAWVTSSWGDRDWNLRPTGNQWSERDLRRIYGAKWEEAARAVFRAALAAVQAGILDEKIGETLEAEGYGPTEIRWPWESASAHLTWFYEQRSDVERLVECWRRWGMRKADADGRPNAKGWRAAGYDRAVDQLATIRDALEQAGRKGEANRVYLRIERLRRSAHWLRVRELRPTGSDRPTSSTRRGKFAYAVRRWIESASKLVFRVLYHGATRSGTGILRTLVAVALVYLVVFPAAFSVFDLLYHVHPGHPGTEASFLPDAMLFSLGSAVGQSVDDLRPKPEWGLVLQVFAGVLGYVSLGVAVWVLTRRAAD
jgi:hypothetical protein